MGRVARGHDYTLLTQLVVTPHEAIGTGAFVLFVGVVVGVAGSIAAVHRFLEV